MKACKAVASPPRCVRQVQSGRVWWPAASQQRGVGSSATMQGGVTACAARQRRQLLACSRLGWVLGKKGGAEAVRVGSQRCRPAAALLHHPAPAPAMALLALTLLLFFFSHDDGIQPITVIMLINPWPYQRCMRAAPPPARQQCVVCRCDGIGGCCKPPGGSCSTREPAIRQIHTSPPEQDTCAISNTLGYP